MSTTTKACAALACPNADTGPQRRRLFARRVSTVGKLTGQRLREIAAVVQAPAAFVAHRKAERTISSAHTTKLRSSSKSRVTRKLRVVLVDLVLQQLDAVQRALQRRTARDIGAAVQAGEDAAAGVARGRHQVGFGACNPER